MSEASLTSNLTGARMSAWVPACTLMLLALLWPAFWNGFPIIFHDTGGYLARPFEATLQMGRAAIYGAFLLIGVSHKFWPNILLQGALVTWLIVLSLRLHGFGDRPWLATSIVATLCVVTGLPWYAAQLMPDILVPLAVLGVALLAFHSDGLRRWERATLVVVIAVAVASHMSILALTLGLLLLLAILNALRGRLPLQRPALRLAAAGVTAGIVLAPLSNYAITREFGFTPGGFNFVFSRLVQDRIVDRYLGDHCPDPAISLCAYRPVMPKTADDWLWALDSPIYKLGGLEEFESEAQRIVLDSLTLYPGMHLTTALTSTVKQLASFSTGDGLTPWSWYTRLTFQYYAPDALDSYVASRQSTSQFDFSWINLVHVPIQALAILSLPLIMLVRPPGRLAEFATLLMGALLGNAAICGVLSNPHDRYQNRLVWLAVLLAMIAALNWRAARNKARRHGVSRADDAINQQQAAASGSLNRAG